MTPVSHGKPCAGSPHARFEEGASAPEGPRRKALLHTTFKTTGTCSQAINYEVTDGVVTKCEFVGGCPGNTQGVAKLVVGRKVEQVVALLKGIQCRNGTSCPDQLARALEQSRM